MLRLGTAPGSSGLLVYRFALSQAEGLPAQFSGSRNDNQP